METIEQALYLAIGKRLGQFVKVYPTLPKEGQKVTYPFATIVEIQELKDVTKSGSKGKFFVTLSVWGTYTQRKQISTICAQVFEALNHIQIEGHTIRLIKQASDKTIREETEGTTTYVRGLIFLEFKHL